MNPQVECNTKLDPTKTTLLKVKDPVSLPLHLLSHVLIQIVMALMEMHWLISFQWLSINLVTY